MQAENIIRIKAYEIDAMGIVSNIVYVKWFEDLRHLLLDKYYPYEDMMSEQQSPILMKTEVEYKKPLTIMHTARGKAWFSKVGLTKWQITLEIWCGDTLHCRGVQSGGFFSMARNRPVAFPQWFVNLYALSETGRELLVPEPTDLDELTALWEASVRATHTFVTEKDIDELRPIVRHQVLLDCNLRCIKNSEGRILAFMGVKGKHLDMLFVHPDLRGQGLGRFLVNHAIGKWNIETVDVNEQNPQAVGFYHYLGFETVTRSATDDAGRPFPILHLKLKKS